MRKLAPVANIKSVSLDTESTLVDNSPGHDHWNDSAPNEKVESVESELVKEKKGLDLDWTNDYDDDCDYDDDDDEEEELDEDNAEMTACPLLEVCNCLTHCLLFQPDSFSPQPVFFPRFSRFAVQLPVILRPSLTIGSFIIGRYP